MKKLDCRSKELVAIGASVTAHCEPCLRVHVQKALEAGATDEEVADAIEVELEEFRDAEVAGVLGISIETVKIRLHRARQLIREKLNNQCSMYRDEDNRVACLPKSEEA